NGTDGGVQIALDAVAAASAPQSFLGIGADGRASLVSTLGNPDVSLILRGGADGPNWETPHVRAAAQALEDRGLRSEERRVGKEGRRRGRPSGSHERR